MDPDEALAKIREHTKFILNPEGENPTGSLDIALMGEFIDRAVEYAAAVEALDEWMTKGGFLPQDWAKGRPSAG